MDGISCHGNVNGLEILHVSVALVSGYGLAYYQSAGVDGDGLWMSRCMFQRTGKSAVHRPVNDANIHNVHIQYAGIVAGAADGHGFFSDAGSAGNMTYVGCRADLCRGSGWLIDHKGSYGDATKLVGCSTERNSQDGVLITNSSAAGTAWRSPVIISGCCFEGDGTNVPAGGGPATGGEYAGIRVQGRNRVFIDGTTVVVSTTDVTAGAPKYALGIGEIGSAPGRAETVEWASGRMNYSTGQGGQAIQNYSLADHLVIGPTVTQVGGYQSTAVSLRTGQVALAGGTATVASPWAFPESLIYLTAIGPSAAMGTPFVAARAAGSFTIGSTSDTDASTIAWLIMLTSSPPEGRGFQPRWPVEIGERAEVHGSPACPAAGLPAQSPHALRRCSWPRSRPRCSGNSRRCRRRPLGSCGFHRTARTRCSAGWCRRD